MFKKRSLNDKQILIFVRLINTSKKFLVFLALFGQLVSILPQQIVHASDVIKDENTAVVEEDTAYESHEVDIATVPIVSEDVSRRTEHEKHFRKLDGTYEVAIYDNEVHYLENGEWKDIDNRFDDKGSYLENKNNSIKTTFPKTLSDHKTISVESKDYSINWKVLDISMSDAEYTDTEKKQSLSSELTGVNQSVIYKNIRNQVDLKYILQGSDVKEYIILNEYQDDFHMTFEYTLKNLKLIETEEDILFVNDSNEAVFEFSKLFMFDSNNQISYDINYEIIEIKKDTYRFTITPNANWLSQADFPVIIDPTLVSTTTNMYIYDTYISQANPTLNYASSQYMYLSNTYWTSQYKGLIYFKIPSLVTNQVITYAHLEFTPYQVSNDAQINIYKNTEGFASSTATWNNAPSYEETPVDYHVVKNNSPFVFDITKPTKEWQAMGATYVDGFTIAHDDESGSVNIVYQNGATTSYRPVVKIGYEEPSGLKDYWTYTSQDLGMAGKGYISDYTGNLTWVRNEYQLQNEYLSMSLSFFHNNYSRSVDIGYGDGWRTNYSYQVVQDPYHVNTFYLRKPDGNKVYFLDQETEIINSSQYVYRAISEDGSKMILEINFYNDIIQDMKIKTISDMEYHFSVSGRLTSIKNIKTNHSLWIYYVDTSSLRISYVKDEADNRINFSYENSILTQTTLSLKQDNGTYREVEKRDYYYDMYNNIDFIDYDFRYGNDVNIGWTTETNNKLQYYFDSNNRLIYAYHEKDFFKVQYGYDGRHRVIQISTTDNSYPLGLTQINYEPSKTTYTDYEGNSINYQFDSYGHTVNIMDDHGNSTYYRYSGLFSFDDDQNSYAYGYDITNIEPNYVNNHRLVESSDVMNQKQNLIQNHGFEESTYGWTLNKGTGNIVFSSDESVLGSKSLKITRLTSSVYANQNVYLTQGEYKVQGWIKNSGAAPGAFIDVENVAYKGTLNKIFNKGEWTKYELTFYVAYPSYVNVKLINDSDYSDAYFDNIQMCEGFVDTRYNTVTNNSFESGTVGWTLSGATVSNLNETGTLQTILGHKALQIEGDGSTTKQAYQTLSYVNGYQGTTLIVGGWAKANAVPNKGYVINDFLQKDDRFFGIVLDVEMEAEVPGPHVFEQFYFPFNSSLDDWQYQMYTLNLEKTVYSVRIYVRYQGEGTALFDQIQLYHEDISTRYAYDSNTGNLTTITRPNGTQTTYTYDQSNHVMSTTENDKEIEFTRNSSYQIEEITQNNVRTTLVYDSTTHQLKDICVGYDKNAGTQDKWFKTSTTYTSDGQYINSQTDEFGNTTASVIDKTIGTVTELIDAIGNIQTFTYDAYGNLISTTIDSSTSYDLLTGSYEYDTSGRLWKIHRDDYTYEFEYNSLNQMTGVIVASVNVMSYEYWMDESETYDTDLLKKQTYGNTDYVEFVYTDENQIETISFNGTIRYEYTYDSSGNLSIFKDIHNDNIYFYSYDLSRRLEKITDKDGNEITYEYDESGNVDRYEYHISGISRSVIYNYNQTTGEYEYTLYNVGGTAVMKDFNYDTDSLKRLNNIDLIIGTNTYKKIFGYDDAKVDSSMGNATHRIYQITYEKNDSTQYIHQYTYDENQNITKIKVIASGTTIEQYDYYYDGFNQLIREDIYLIGQLYKTMTYSYDLQNNIASIKTYAYNVSSGTPLNEKKMYYQNTWKDQLTKIEYYVNGSLSYYQTFSYDASGNVTNLTDSRTSYANKSYMWDGRQFVEYLAYSNHLYFKYNDQGIRTQKIQETPSGTTTINYFLDGDKVLVETRSNGITLYFTYDVDGTLLSMNYNGAEYFYITNMQGDIIELVDINGNSVVKYNYDAWGNIIYQSGGALADINPYRYRGYRLDVETGLYYLQSRYYDPSIGRFISSDGLLGETGNILTHNMYAYCANNPVMYVDPSGEFALILIPPALLIALTAIVVLYTVSLFSDEILDFVEEAVDSIESEYEKTLKKEYTVYTLIDKDNVVRYVGRVKTENYSTRMEYHRATKPGLSPGPMISNLNYWECRGVEQLGIIAHSSAWFDVKSNPSGNIINGIGIRNPFRFDYYRGGIRYIWNNIENEWTNLINR